MHAAPYLKNQLSNQVGIQVSESNVIYMGNPLFIQRNKIREFSKIVENNAAKIEGWKTKILYHASTATLVRSCIYFFSYLHYEYI